MCMVVLFDLSLSLSLSTTARVNASLFPGRITGTGTALALPFKLSHWLNPNPKRFQGTQC